MSTLGKGYCDLPDNTDDGEPRLSLSDDEGSTDMVSSQLFLRPHQDGECSAKRLSSREARVIPILRSFVNRVTLTIKTTRPGGTAL